MAVLYLVATPIGNLEDITLRALRVLKEVELIAAEDTRTTRKLLNRYRIETRCVSYHEHNRALRIPQLIESLRTKDVALVSEAGMPGISDPGYELVREAVKSGFEVIPIPGASAVTAALAASGLPAGGARFLGFLPRRKSDRRRCLESLRMDTNTVVAFESPHRLRASLEDAFEVLGDRDMAIFRELTKLHEEVFRGTISQAHEHFTQPKGEFTLVIAGAAEVRKGGDLELARDELKRLKEKGLKAKQAVATVARETGNARRDVYRIWLSLKPD